MAEYYGVVLHLSDGDLDAIVATNKALATLSGLDLSRVGARVLLHHYISHLIRQPRHLNVVITCAHTDVAYILASRIALGAVFGASELVTLHLYAEREQASALLGASVTLTDSRCVVVDGLRRAQDGARGLWPLIAGRDANSLRSEHSRCQGGCADRS